MFHQSTLSVVLATLVVLCPFQCTFGACLVDGPNCQDAVRPGCCQHCDPPVDDSDGDPSPDCDCRDCFCRGALPVKESSIDLVGTHSFCWMTVVVRPELAPVDLPAGRFLCDSQKRPVNASALELRAALGCWVI